MSSTDEGRNKQADAVSKSASLLVLLLQQLHLRVGLRAHLHLHPPAGTLLKQLDHAREQLGKLSNHAPRSREATKIVVDGFQVAFEVLEWLDHAPLPNETSSSHRLAEQPAEPAAVLMNQSGPNLEQDQREALKHRISRIQQNLLESGHSQTTHSEHIQQSPVSKPKPEQKTRDPKTPQ